MYENLWEHAQIYLCIRIEDQELMQSMQQLTEKEKLRIFEEVFAENFDSLDRNDDSMYRAFFKNRYPEERCIDGFELIDNDWE